MKTEFEKKVDAACWLGFALTPFGIGLGVITGVTLYSIGFVDSAFLAGFGIALVGPCIVLAALWTAIVFDPRRKP